MGVRKERGPGGMMRVVIDRKKRKKHVPDPEGVGVLSQPPYTDPRPYIPPVEGIPPTPPVARPQRRPRKSYPIRPQYREFGGRVEKQTYRLPVGAIFFLALLIGYVAFALLVYNIFAVFVLGFVAVGIGLGYSLYPLMKWNRREA